MSANEDQRLQTSVPDDGADSPILSDNGAGLRETGIQLLDDVPWGTHFCQFYQTKQDLIEILVPYFQSGLANNEFCMWITSDPLNAEEAISALRSSVPDLDRRIADGQIEVIPYDKWYVVDGEFDQERVLEGWVEKLRQARSKGYEGLRLTGNTFWLEKADWDDFTQYEEAVNNVIGRYRMMALCTYSLDRCGAAEIADVVANHEFAFIKRRGEWSIIESSTVKQAQQALQTALKETEALNEELRAEIAERRRAEEALRQSEERVRRKLDSLLSPEGAIEDLELSDILDVDILQSLMNDFHSLTGFPSAIIDTNGNVLAGVGWQDICMRFHRAHPETFECCIESDTELTKDVPPGEARLYKCRNNMWDVATPVVIGGQRLGNVFSGQFFFDDEPVDSEFFRLQAERYGFDSDDYIDALHRVPRLSRQTVDSGISFIIRLSDTLSQLSFSNIKLARSLSEQEKTGSALHRTNERLELLSNTASRLLVAGDPQAEVQTLCEQVMAHLDCDVFFNYLCDSDSGRLHLNACSGIGEADRKSIEWLDYGVAVCGCAARDACRIVAEDIAHTPDPRTDLVRSFGVQAYACHPLLGYENQVIGTLSFGAKTRPEFSDEDLALMKTVADQVATAMERIRLQRDAERRAEELQAVMDAVPVAVWIANDPACDQIVGNEVANRFYEAEEGENVSANVSDARKFFQNGREAGPEELPMQYACLHDAETGEREFEVLTPGGQLRVLLGYANPLHDSDGSVRGCVGAFMDITERRRAEDALREREEYLRLFIEHAPAALALFDTEMRYIAASRRWTTDYDLPEDLAGQSHYEVFPGVPERWKEVHRRCLAGEVLRADEDGFERADGRVQWLRWETLPWKRADGSIGGIVIFSEDITERKLAREALERYRILAESARDIILFVGLDGKIVEANSAAVLAYGYTHEEMLGLLLSDLRMPGAPGSDWAQIAESGAGGVLFETIHRRKDGTVFPVEVGSQGAEIAGRKVLVSIIRDITERKITEQRRAELYEREHHIAQVLQQALIPPNLPSQLGDLAIGVRYRSALKEAEVGGDFYDVFDLGGGKVGILVGDVAGKGLAAAIRVAAARYSIRSYAFREPRPSHVMTLANAALCKDTEGEVNMLTAFMAVIDTEARIMTYATAGHEPPVVCSAAGRVTELDGGEMPLGIVEATGYTEHKIGLQPGDSLVAITDGITEARTGQILFDKSGVKDYLSHNISDSPDKTAEGLLARALEHAGGELQDDAAVVVIRLGSKEPDGSTHGR